MPGPAKLTQTTLFYAYEHTDEILRKQLEQHLRPLQRDGLLSTWHDRKILPGAEMISEINEHLNNADIILLLVSAHFMDSDYCYNIEMQRAMELQQRGKTRVIPLILSPCDWRSAPFGHLQCLPRNGGSITESNNLDAAFTDVAHHLRQIIQQQETVSLAEQVPPLLSAVQQNRERMLQLLQRWYEDFLTDSLQSATWLDLDLTEQPDALHNPITLLIRTSYLPGRVLPPGTSIVQVYQNANQELLILGAPGSGKSTHLYMLAQYLFQQAKINHSQPLPIVFDLSSWAEKCAPLPVWMAERLTQLYKVPEKLAQQWIQNQQIIPLLDGLDEMDEAARPLCIIAINAYHREYLHPLVVCSRSTEYKAASVRERLRLQNAVEMQPLTTAQVNTILAQGGKPLAALRTEFKKNFSLQQLITTPLMLNLFIITYSKAPVRDFPTKRAALQHQVFKQYVERMIERKGNGTLYPSQQTYVWLHWLACQMHTHQQTVFTLEMLQPDWLPQPQKSSYHSSLMLITGLLYGALFGLFGVHLPRDAQRDCGV